MGRVAAFAVGPDAGNVVGAWLAGTAESPSACIVIPDQFGWKDHHARRLCDDLAAAASTLVVCPDVHRGGYVDECTIDAVCTHLPPCCSTHP